MYRCKMSSCAQNGRISWFTSLDHGFSIPSMIFLFIGPFFFAAEVGHFVLIQVGHRRTGDVAFFLRSADSAKIIKQLVVRVRIWVAIPQQIIIGRSFVVLGCVQSNMCGKSFQP